MQLNERLKKIRHCYSIRAQFFKEKRQNRVENLKKNLKKVKREEISEGELTVLIGEKRDQGDSSNVNVKVWEAARPTERKEGEREETMAKDEESSGGKKRSRLIQRRKLK